MDQKLATKRKISSQTQNSFFITEQQIQRLTQKVIRELEHKFTKKDHGTAIRLDYFTRSWPKIIGQLVRKIGSLCERILH
jgi:hypothetical protein